MSWLLIDSPAAPGTVGPTHSRQANRLNHLPKDGEISSGRSGLESLLVHFHNDHCSGLVSGQSLTGLLAVLKPGELRGTETDRLGRGQELVAGVRWHL